MANDIVNETTFIMIKPDGVRRGLVGEIIYRLEAAGLRITALKVVNPTRELIDGFYPAENAWIRRLGEKTLAAYSANGIDATQEIGTSDPSAIGHMVRNWLLDYMTSGPVIPIAVNGIDAVNIVRNQLVGATMPAAAGPGTIRGDFSADSSVYANRNHRAVTNLVHATETLEEAERELRYWFGDVMTGNIPNKARIADSETIATYDALACEYDLPEHHTTRVLEHLTTRAWSLVTRGGLLAGKRKVTELGCGTGSFSRVLLDTLSEAVHFHLVDASRFMLAICRVKLRDQIQRREIRIIQSTVEDVSVAAPLSDSSLIVAGLADPFLTDEAVAMIRRSSMITSYLFFTLPARDWAVAERRSLGLSDSTLTRFRSVTGRSLRARSYTYEETEIRQMLERHRFRIIQLGSLQHSPINVDHERLHDNPAAITYCLAQVV